jgi:hypothetical protein
MVVANKTKLSTTVCTTVLQLGHEALPRLEVGRAMLSGAGGGIAIKFVASFDLSSIALCACPGACRVDKKDALPRGFRRINVLQ